MGAIWMFERKSWLAGLLWLFLVLIQPLDAFLIALVLMMLLVLKWGDLQLRRYLLRFFSIGIVFGIALLLVQPDLWMVAGDIFLKAFSSLDQLESSAQTGIFLDLISYGYASGLIVALGLLGWVMSWRKEGINIWNLLVLILMVWVTLSLFFWQRLLVVFEVPMILFAAQVLDELWVRLWRRGMYASLMMFILAAVLVPFVFELSAFSPEVDVDELASITSFCAELGEGDFVMATDGVYGPWLRGFCPEQIVMSPGQFESDPWTLDQWKLFWTQQDQQAALVHMIPHSFFAYVGLHQFPVELDPRLFEKLGKGWWGLRALPN